MDRDTQDLREMLHMVALLKGAAARAVFRDCSATFLGVAELLERRVVTLAESEIERRQAPPPAPTQPSPPVNIMT